MTLDKVLGILLSILAAIGILSLINIYFEYYSNKTKFKIGQLVSFSYDSQIKVGV